MKALLDHFATKVPIKDYLPDPRPFIKVPREFVFDVRLPQISVIDLANARHSWV